MFTKVGTTGLCLACMEKQLSELEQSITPEMRDAVSLAQLIADKKAELQTLESRERDARSRTVWAEEQARRASLNLIVAEERVELETFSLYEPRFDFVTSDAYKARLDALREQQKRMIKDKTAATCATAWRVNGSEAQGQRMTAEFVKLFLRSFNNECDIAVSSVKFSNYNRCRERIAKSFEAINKLGKVNGASLSPKYLEL